MLGKHKLLFLIPTILLIPVLLGMTPLNMAHRLATGGPFTHCKQAQWSNYCPFHSFISHDDPTTISLDSTRVDRESTPTVHAQVFAFDLVHSYTSVNSVPLRC
jgi:hypothetical protein